MDEICLASSEPARMTDVRLRIEHDFDAVESSIASKFVYSIVPRYSEIPANAIVNFNVKFAKSNYYFYATEARASEILGDNYKLNQLIDRFQYEKQLWLAWAEGHVYRIMLESWNAEKRDWQLIKTFDGIYGAGMVATTTKRILENCELFGYPKAELVCCDSDIFDELSAE